MFKFITRVWNAVVEFFFGKKEESATAEPSRKEEPEVEPVVTSSYVPVPAATVPTVDAEAAIIDALSNKGETEELPALARFIVNAMHITKNSFVTELQGKATVFEEGLDCVLSDIAHYGKIRKSSMWKLVDDHVDYVYCDEEVYLTPGEIRAKLQTSLLVDVYGEDVMHLICKHVMAKTNFAVACEVNSYLYLFDEVRHLSDVNHILHKIDAMDFTTYTADSFFREIGFISDKTLQQTIADFC